jgi:hypothetical protein
LEIVKAKLNKKYKKKEKNLKKVLKKGETLEIGKMNS